MSSSWEGSIKLRRSYDVLQNMATDLLSGKSNKPHSQSQPQSGLTGMAGNLVGSLLSGGKPHGQPSQQHSQQSGMFGGSHASANSKPGGLMGLASGLLSHSGSSVRNAIIKSHCVRTDSATPYRINTTTMVTHPTTPRPAQAVMQPMLQRATTTLPLVKA